MANIIFNAVKKIVCANPSTDFYPSAVTSIVSAGGTPTATTLADIDITTTTPTSATTSSNVNVTGGNLSNNLAITSITNNTPAVGTLAGTTLTSIANGTCNLTVEVKYKGKKRLMVPTSIAANPVTARNSSFATGSLREHMRSQVIAATAGKTGEFALRVNTPAEWFSYPVGGPLPAAAVNQYLYSDTDKVSSWTRNNSHILSAIDLTGMSALRNYGQEGWNGGSRCTLISPRHALVADHWRLEIGRSQYFVTASNTIVSAVIDGYSRIGTTDIGIIHFASDIPASIKPFKVLPSNFLSYLPQPPSLASNASWKSAIEYQVPAYLCFGEVINIGGFAYSDPIGFNYTEQLTSFSVNSQPISNIPADLQNLYSFGNQGLFGSGSTVFTVINGEAVVLFTLFSAGYYGRGPHREYAAINAAMTALHGAATYQLTPANLAGFNATY